MKLLTQNDRHSHRNKKIKKIKLLEFHFLKFGRGILTVKFQDIRDLQSLFEFFVSIENLFFDF